MPNAIAALHFPSIKHGHATANTLPHPPGKTSHLLHPHPAADWIR